MAEQKKDDVVFDPRAPQFRRKLWVHVQTTDGRRLIVFWSRVGALLAVLLLLTWLALGTAAWGFVRYQRGVAAVRWVDIAFYPLRKAAYRSTLGRHHLATGQVQLKEQRWNEAVLSLRAAVAYAPELTEARRILADFYVAVKQPQLALQYLESGLPFVRDDAAYLQRLVQLCFEVREPARVVRLAETWLPAQPDATPVHRQVALQAAEALRELRRWDECEAILKRWQIDQSADGQMILAERDLARGQLEPALQRLEAALAADSANEMLALQLTRLYRQHGRLADARRITLLRSLARPDSPGARIDLLVLEGELGRHEDFGRGVDTFLRTYVADSAALQLLARTAADKADPDLAARVLARAREAGHPPTVFLFGLVQAQCGAGQYTEALATTGDIDREPPLTGRGVATLMAFKCWAHYGTGNVAEGDVWLHRFVSERDFPIGDALGLAAALERMQAVAAADRVLGVAAERPDVGELPLLNLAALRVRHHQWPEARQLLPRLKALPEPPAELIGTIESNVQLLGL
jgi:tetratricopeptide (TPR) repeat protein